MGTNKINLISSKEQIGEFLQDFNINNSNFINVLNRHIIRAVEIIGIDNYFVRCYKKEFVDNGRVVLPCKAKYLEAVISKINDCTTVIDIDNENLSILKELDLVNKPVSIGYINGAYLEIALNDNHEVYIIYKSLPLDKEGYLIIPDDALLREAINFFIIYKISFSGFKHPVVSRKEAYDQWNFLYPQAKNSVNFPTIEEMQRFTEMWNNPIKGDLLNDLFN